MTGVIKSEVFAAMLVSLSGTPRFIRFLPKMFNTRSTITLE